MKQQVKDLEAEKTEPVNSGRPAVMGMSGGQSRKAGLKNYMGQDHNNKANEDLINFLEHKLEEIEKKLQRTQNDYEILQNDYTDL